MKLIKKIRELTSRWMHDTDDYSEMKAEFDAHPEFKSDELIDSQSVVSLVNCSIFL